MRPAGTLLAVVAATILSFAGGAEAQPPPSGQFVACIPDEPGTEYLYGSHQVTVFSEGTAWANRKWVWLTVFNPTNSTQTVWIRFYVDGDLGAHPNGWYWKVSVPAHDRYAVNMNDQLAAAGFRGMVNFATTVMFSTMGVANMAVWDWYYQDVVYLLGTNQCMRW